jgi:pimeloyl-ACP methyl ester carboxylesterase
MNFRSFGRQSLAGLIGAAALLALTGCSLFLRATPAPIPTQASPASPAGRAPALVVFLPGRGDRLADFEREGMVATLREAGVQADTVVVDAHLGYYLKQTVVERLRTDVLLPARRQGYRRIVLVGVSLGGLGSVLTERDHPGSVDALVLLAPYLGEKKKFFERIAAAGGPAAWAKGRDPRAGFIEEQVWTFLGSKTSALPPTWLLSGTEDPYARGHRLFATLLPANRVTTIPGAHEWPVWRALWRDVCFHSEVFAAERTGATRH